MTTARLITNIEAAESCVLTAYPDPLSLLAAACVSAGIALPHFKRLSGWESISGHPWTCGWGCTGPDIGPDTIWTQEEADARLNTMIAEAETGLDQKAPWWRSLDPIRQDAFAELAFNMGVDGWLGKFPHTVAEIKAGQYGAAADALAGSLWARQVHHTRADRIVAMIRTGVQP